MHLIRLASVSAVAALVALSLSLAPVARAESPGEKLQALISEMSPSQQASLLLLLTEMKGAGKAATSEKAATSPEEGIKKLMDGLKAALEGEDIDALLALFSEDFSHPQVGGKEEARFMLNMGLESGYAEGGEVYLDDAEIEKLDDGTYSVYPIDLTAYAGSVSVELIVIEEGDGFAIYTLDVEGI